MDLVGFMLSCWINAWICGLYLIVAGLCLYLMVADLCLCFVLQHLRKNFQSESFTDTNRVFKCRNINRVSKTRFLGGQTANSDLIRT